MVQRYYLDLTDGQSFIRDAVGVEAVDLTQVVEEVLRVLAQSRRDGDLSDVTAPWRMFVRDAQGHVIHVMPVAPCSDGTMSAAPEDR